MIRIKVKNLNKKFKIGFSKNESFLSRIINFILIKEDKKELQVLKDISLEINSGEYVGIIGKNGSGKSTLLRVISGIYKNYTGEVETDGKIISLINIGSGFKYRLTMKENIYLVCSLFGLTHKEIEKNFNSIVEFSELQNYVNTKMFQFSSGMIQRLAFSIAINSYPEILILDEVFEVGDNSFKKKSREKIKELTNKNVTVLLVTHEVEILSNLCNRIIWMNKGMIKEDGDPGEIISQYS